MREFQYYHLNLNLNFDQNDQINRSEAGPNLTELLSKKPNVATWETCLRKIVFFEPGADIDGLMDQGGYVLRKDQIALEFLIEILCGLQSKIIGETEVLGQFRKFIDSADSKKVLYFQNMDFINFIFQQVKEIRKKYLFGLSIQSYGSLVRKECKHYDSISIVGHGQLARELLRWLDMKKVNVHIRDQKRYLSTKHITYQELAENAFQPMVVIAAPIPTEKLLVLFKNQSISQIIDFRTLDQKQLSLKGRLGVSNILELKDFFGLQENSKLQIEKILPVIKVEVSRRVKAYLLRENDK